MTKLLIIPAMMTVTMILDFIFLGTIANHLYVEAFAPFGRIVDGKFEPFISAALFVYVVMAIAIYVFVLSSIDRDSFVTTLLKGALLGFSLYAVYDLTNLATIRDWSLFISVVDVAWGTICVTIVAVFGRYLLSLKFFKQKPA